MGESLIQLEDMGGVWPVLLTLSAFAAKERGSELLEPCDLVKAIYIADLEHVSGFWSNWEGFERFVSNQTAAAGYPKLYINRMIYLIRVELTKNAMPAHSFTPFGNPSPQFREAFDTAKTLVKKREGEISTPTSKDFLLAICSNDQSLSIALQKSGLQLEKLKAAVEEPSF
jgi:hypothetical protein